MTVRLLLIRLSVLIPLLFALAGGCATSQKDELGPELRSILGIDEKLTDTSKEDLEKTFDASTLIRRAETFYSKEEFETALVEYQRFLDLHPIDRLANLARFRIGLCYYHQIHSPDRDQEPMQKALNTFQNLVAEAPQSLYAQKSEPYIVELKKSLAEREYYIGYFYFKKGSYNASIARLESLLSTYPDAPKSEDALFYLGLCYRNLGNFDKSGNLFSQLLKRFPGSSYREKIDRLNDSRSAS